MNLASITISPLVVTEYGTGFMDLRTRELRKSFGIHVSPEPQDVRPATEDEAREFFMARVAHANALGKYYDRADRLLHNTGD